MSVKEKILSDIDELGEEDLWKLAEFIVLLKSQEKVKESWEGLEFKPPIQVFQDSFADSAIRIRRHSEIRMTDEEKDQYLKELLVGITDENLRPEIRTGPPVGDEAW